MVTEKDLDVTLNGISQAQDRMYKNVLELQRLIISKYPDDKELVSVCYNQFVSLLDMANISIGVAELVQPDIGEQMAQQRIDAAKAKRDEYAKHQQSDMQELYSLQQQEQVDRESLPPIL